MRKIAAFLCLLILGILAYGASVSNGFVLDDLIHIRNNHLLGLSDGGRQVISIPAFPGNLYRPVTFYSYWLQTQLFGFDPLPFHAVNVLLHILVACVLYRVAEVLLGKEAGLMIAALFVVHPLHSEAVANVSGRAEILAALFTLCALLQVSSNKRVSGLLIAILSFLAAGSKESGILAPLLFFGYGIALQRFSAVPFKKETVVYSFSGVVAYLALRSAVLGGHLYSSFSVDIYDNPLAALSVGRRVLEALALLDMSITKITFPYLLSADYSFAAVRFGEQIAAINMVSALAVVCLLGIAIGYWRKRVWAPCIVWFFVAFSLTANIFFPIGTAFAERLSYLPSIGLLASLVVLFRLLIGQRLSRGLFSLTIVLFAFSSAKHSAVWRSAETLADYQENVSPESFRTQLLCAERDRNQRKFAQAILHAEKSIAILPKNEDAYLIKAQSLSALGDWQAAEASFERALQINGGHLPSLIFYGRHFINIGDTARARVVAQRITHMSPDHPEGLLIELAAALKEKDGFQAKVIADKLDRMNFESDEYSALKKFF